MHSLQQESVLHSVLRADSTARIYHILYTHASLMGTRVVPISAFSFNDCIEKGIYTLDGENEIILFLT